MVELYLLKRVGRLVEVVWEEMARGVDAEEALGAGRTGPGAEALPTAAGGALEPTVAAVVDFT
jgi:hypothetical protein